MSQLPCRNCEGSGASCYDGECVECHGSGNQKCDNRGCDELAIGFNDDGDALCPDCLTEWAMQEFDT
jgi:RecJ-like exonuclease